MTHDPSKLACDTVGVVRATRGHLWRRVSRRAMLVLAALAAISTMVPGPAAAQTSCDELADPSWKQSETLAWQHLCNGEWADFNADGFNDRAVSSAFVEQLLTGPYARKIDRHGIRLNGASIHDTLNISDATTSFPLRCQNCRIAGLTAHDAVIDGALDLRQSTIEGDISLVGADIRGLLSLSDGSVVSGTLMGDQLTVAQSMFLGGGSEFADISLPGADIGGQLSLSDGSVVSGTLIGDHLTVGGDVFLRGGSEFADIRLPGADIGGQLSLSDGSVVSGELHAENLTVAESLFLGGSEFADINLAGADIGGPLAPLWWGLAAGGIHQP